MLMVPQRGRIRQAAAGGGFGGWTITGGTENNGNASSTTLTLGRAPASGDLILVFLSLDSGGADENPGFTGSSPLLEIHDSSTPATTSNNTFYVLHKIADGTEGTSLSVSWDSSEPFCVGSMVITGNRNGLTTSEISYTLTNTSSATELDPPSHSPSWGSAENLWVIAGYHENNLPYSTTPSGYTVVTNNGSTNRADLFIGYQEVTAATEDPGVSSTESGRDMLAVTIGIRPND